MTLNYISQLCEGGFKRWSDWHDPVGAFAKSRFVQRGVQNYPLATRTALIALNAPIGLVKPFLLPIISAIAVLVQPVIAAVRVFQHDDESAKKWLVSWGFSILTLGVIAGFMVLSAYKLTLLQGTYCVIAACSISLAIHVYRVC